jgi:hypothetical protein
METFGNVFRLFRKPVLCLQHEMRCLAKTVEIDAIVSKKVRLFESRIVFATQARTTKEIQCSNGLLNTSCSSSVSVC